MASRWRYPITAGVVLVLVCTGVAGAIAACLWGILGKTWFWVLLVLYIIAALKLIVLARALEDHEPWPSFWTRTYARGFRLLNRFVPWHRLPAYLGSLNLLAFRHELREKNLHAPSSRETSAPQWDPKHRAHRTADGTFNDLQHPMMGAKEAHFGRNTPLDRIRFDEANLLTPSPREVSRRLLTRDTFIPATSLNLLAAAWIQFQNHDWFSHRRDPSKLIKIDLKPGDDWPRETMDVPRTLNEDPTAPGNMPFFRNEVTHWWDASQLYGSDKARQDRVRAGQEGKLRIQDNGLLPPEEDPDLPGIDLTGMNDNWWVGLSLLHTLFTMEHNAICDRLRGEHPHWSDEQLFQTARLINAALIAKIHTVEWTPGILGHSALQISMNGNWWGLLGERYRRAFGRLSDSEAISGIMGSSTQQHAAPYSLTEEFVSVYRLHPLIPDEYVFRSLQDHAELTRPTFTDIQGNATRAIVQEYGLPNLFYSFGVMHPGAVTLHNFPKSLQRFERIKDKTVLDLATIDVLRDRERGVPRYNDFRRMLHKPRVKSFSKLTDNPQWARELEEVYDGEIDNVDLMIGLYAEPLPKGFGFSDTAFRVFILMASRRLKSDRFFTVDYRPEVYTQTGLDWIDQNNMRTVLKRHFPELTPAIQRCDNAFAPWSRVR